MTDARLPYPGAMVGCERIDGTLQIHPWAETCAVCGPRLVLENHELRALRAPGDAGPDATDFGLLSRAIELLMANEREYAPSNAVTDWYLRDQRVLALLREVTTRGPRPDPETPQ